MKIHRSYWKVPNSAGTGHYTVALRNDGQTECSCLMRSKGEGAYPCWHSMVVVAIASVSTHKIATASLIQAARTGDFAAQLGLIGLRIKSLADMHAYDSVKLAAKTLNQYVAAYENAELKGIGGRIRRVTRAEARKDVFLREVS